MIALAPQIRRLRRRLADETATALVLALGISTALGVSAAASVAYATHNESSATRDRGEQLAQTLAEGALNNALAALHDADNPADPGAVPQTSRAYEGGTATWHGALQGDLWTLTGTGRVRNSSGTADIVRTVSGRARLGSTRVSSANNAVWNYLYTDELTGCTKFANSVLVSVPVYIRGNLCMSNQAVMTGYSLRVGGNVTISNSATVGTAESPLQEAHIGGTCTLSGGTPHSPCSAADRIFANVITAEPTGLTKPAIDLEYWYAEARPGPMHPCTTGSFPGGFDNDSVMNRSRAAVDLTPTTAYDCTVLDADGFVVGRIAWTPGSPGKLVIAGTIFFDGDIAFTQQNHAVYEGRATIYSTGKITIGNQTTLCGVAGCTNEWDPNQNLLAFVAGSSTDSDSFAIGNFSKFQGAVYAVNDFREGNNTVVWGPVIARQVYLLNSTVHHYIPIGTLVPGMPATYEEVQTITYLPSSYGS